MMQKTIDAIQVYQTIGTFCFGLCVDISHVQQDVICKIESVEVAQGTNVHLMCNAHVIHIT
jgi:hypothetical protein